jgi:hypothetical protein
MVMKFSPVLAKAAAVTAIALAAAGTASVAQARGNVFFSIGGNIAPGVAVGVSNMAPVYYPPVTYVQPAPVYVEPAPVYMEAQPVYYGYGAPVYYGGGYAYGHRHWAHERWEHGHGGHGDHGDHRR